MRTASQNLHRRTKRASKNLSKIMKKWSQNLPKNVQKRHRLLEITFGVVFGSLGLSLAPLGTQIRENWSQKNAKGDSNPDPFFDKMAPWAPWGPKGRQRCPKGLQKGAPGAPKWSLLGKNVLHSQAVCELLLETRLPCGQNP